MFAVIYTRQTLCYLASFMMGPVKQENVYTMLISVNLNKAFIVLYDESAQKPKKLNTLGGFSDDCHKPKGLLLFLLLTCRVAR